MQRTTAARHRSSGLRLEAAAAANPEWAPWLRLLARARAAARAGWSVALGITKVDASAPLLHDAVLALDTERLTAWTSEVFVAARSEEQSGKRPGSLDRAEAVTLLEAAIALDANRLDGMADRLNEDAHWLAAVTQLVSMPVLRACRARLQSEIPRGWTRGYCPACGTWPAFAELRGLERERRARCGRCACDWRFDVLRCPFCDERDHAQLGGLVVDGEEERRRVDTCKRCRGYLKGISTLMAVPDDDVPVVELETVELDLVATERGFTRPDGPAVPVALTVCDLSEVRLRSDARKWLFAD